MIGAIILMLCINMTIFEETDWSFEKRQEYITRKRDPWFAAFSSLLLPGSGQCYNHDWVKGGINLVGIAGWITLMSYTELRDGETIRPYADFSAICLLGHWVFSPIDAYCSAIHKNIRVKRTLGIIEVGLYEDKPGVGLSYKF